MCTQLFSKIEYDLDYKLVSDGEKIGTMKVIGINNQNIHTYTTHVNMKFKYLFTSYTYIYKEIAKLKDGKILSLDIYEDDDGKILETKASRKKNQLLYENGKSVNLDEVDYLPFDIRAVKLNKPLEDKNFKLITFDPQTTHKVFEQYTLSKKTSESVSYEVLVNDEVETQTFNQKNILTYAKNKFFETILLNASK